MSDTPAAKTECGNGATRSGWAAIAIALALLVPAFWWTGTWMVVRWEAMSGYYSHGWLVAPVSVVLLWLNRKRLAACPRQPNLRGLLLVIAALLLHVAGVGLMAGMLSGLALVALIAGLVLTLFGPRMLRLTLFPILFLLFMIPVPAVVIETVSFNMKLLAAMVATKVLDFIGLVVVRDGSIIHLPASEYIPRYQRLIVDDVCSGLKYLISLTAFGALYAYIARVKYRAKAILFVLSIPVSFVANVLRVILMVLVAYRWGVERVEGRIHDFFGIMLFVVAFAFLFLMEWLLCRVFHMGAEEDTDAGTTEGVPTPCRQPVVAVSKHLSAPQDHTRQVAIRPSRRLQALLLAMFAVTAACSVYLSWPRPAVSVSGILASIPRTIGDWQGTEGHITDHEMAVLGTRDVVTIHYAGPDNKRVRLLLVIARHTRKRTHPPEQCYRGEGYRRRSARDIVRTIGQGAGEITIPLRELVFEKGANKRVVWYFFKCREELTANWWTHQGRVAWRKLLRLDAADILIRVDTGAGPTEEQVEEGRACLQEFIKIAVPAILPKLP